MRMKIDCCKRDCPKRCADPNCHSYCKVYNDQREALDAENAALFKENQLQHGITDVLIKGVNKTMRRPYLKEKNWR